MKEDEFKEFLRSLVDLKPEDRLHEIRENWKSLTKEQQDVLEEFLEHLRESTEEEVEIRRGESATVAPERIETREEEPSEEAAKEKGDEDIYIREETTTSSEETEEETRPYRPPETSEEKAFTLISDEEKSTAEEEEYRSAKRFARETKQTEIEVPREFETLGEMETDAMRKLKKKYLEEM